MWEVGECARSRLRLRVGFDGVLVVPLLPPRRLGRAVVLVEDG